MPVALPIIAGVAAATAVVGTVKTIQAQNKANKLAKEQFAYEKQLNNNKVARERRDAIRAARLTGGQLSQAAVNQGASSTSAAIGAQGSIISQLDSNLSFLDTSAKLNTLAGDAGIRRGAALNTAQNWGAVSNLSMQVFGMAAGRIK